MALRLSLLLLLAILPCIVHPISAAANGRALAESVDAAFWLYEAWPRSQKPARARAPNGFAHHLRLGMGTPPLNSTFVFDTVGALPWAQCQPCVHCLPQEGAIYNPLKSTSFVNLTCPSAGGTGCPYNFSYGGDAFTSGYLATETLTVFGRSFKNITFGCGTLNQGYYDNVAGALGLGRGNLSVPNQLGVDTFGYCFAPRATFFFFGSPPQLVPNTIAATTPIVENPALPSGYFVRLVSVTVGPTSIDVPAASDLLIDSKSPFTFLEPATYALVREALVAQLKPLKEASSAACGAVGLDLCFEADNSTNATPPEVTLRFDGDANLMVSEYLVEMSSRRLLCLAMLPSSKGSFPVLGRRVLMGTPVIYDLAKNVISFQPVDCATFGATFAR
ncbi:aspartic proteinase nepenthesin-2-like [Phragmites australis]|uniref:aspartic proteinase nepenthesin-2-like n=1 Tax=Phragmites australis TaxID=29695 RepID=UPI002D78AA66|nr:aspartic proteinase nepenthesin-2-like [Phragmites australis]